MKKTTPRIVPILLSAFALLTLFLSGSIIFDLFGIRTQEGNYVLLVVWANFICSLLYLAAAYGLVKLKRWPYKVLIVAAVVLSLGLAGLFIHINQGGLYETKTIGAMVFRIGVTLVFAYYCYQRLGRGKQFITLV